MTRGELERAYSHLQAWMELRAQRRRIAAEGVILQHVGEERSLPMPYPGDHPMVRALVRQLDEAIANEAQILTLLGIEMTETPG